MTKGSEPTRVHECPVCKTPVHPRCPHCNHIVEPVNIFAHHDHNGRWCEASGQPFDITTTTTRKTGT
jgi:hypothetical protein